VLEVRRDDYRWATSVDWCADGALLAIGDGTVRVQDVGTREEARLRGHAAVVRSVAWSPDGMLLASGGDLTVRIWGEPQAPAQPVFIRRFQFVTGNSFDPTIGIKSIDPPKPKYRVNWRYRAAGPGMAGPGYQPRVAGPGLAAPRVAGPGTYDADLVRRRGLAPGSSQIGNARVRRFRSFIPTP
jgi:hypothetical protein